MKWRQDLNETHIQEDGRVLFRVFATGEGLEVSLDNKNFIKANCSKEGVDGFQFIVNPKDVPTEKGRKLQNFWVKEWGALTVPFEDKGATPMPSPEPIPEPTPELPSDWYKGVVGKLYQDLPKHQTEYDLLLKQVDGGLSEFEFYGNPNVNYPEPVEDAEKIRTTGTDFISMRFPSHSTTCQWNAVKDFHLVSMVQMRLHDQDGNLVWSLHDTKGGFHPLDTGNDNKRGNNHPWATMRYLKRGHYKCTIKNISQDKRVGQRFEFLIDGESIHDENGIRPNETKMYNLDLTQGEWAKLNCNLYNLLE